MCRICGVLDKNVSEQVLFAMRDSLHYGGPDDTGFFIDKEFKIGLGHRRLSVIDTSIAGHQPMYLNNFVIVFNGEIYNFKEVKEELLGLGHFFSSNSDTEIILKSFESWGYEFVKKFHGMFSFAIWDKKEEKLLLCRDRVGVKPLYWYLNNDLFMFASELKAFHEHPDFDKSLNYESISLFLQTGYIKSPFSIFKYAHKLEPGSFLEIDKNFNIKTWKYWSIRDYYKENEISRESDTHLISKCEELLTDSFNLRMVSDVPVGMFLSGGIDSSIVTSILQNSSSKRLNTFTIGFEDKRFNEANYAKSIAKHIGTDHNELYCNENDFKSIIPILPDIYDEPFGDSSAIPTYLVSQLAKSKVKVSLSADGGDEIFGGYSRYMLTNSYYNKIRNIPLPIRKIGSKFLQNISIDTLRKLNGFLPNKVLRNLDSRLPKLVEVLKSQNQIDFLYSATKNISNVELTKIIKFDKRELIFDKNLISFEDKKLSAFGLLDIESYLEGDILTKVDRATMRVALEGREPFLDHKIIEFGMDLPDNLKFRDGQTKWILRQILYKYVPKYLLDRPKMGFGIPLDAWLSNFLKEELQLLKNDNYFFELFRLNQNEIRNILDLYCEGKYNNPSTVWFIFVLHQWYLRWI